MKKASKSSISINGWRYNPRKRIPMKAIRAIARRIAGQVEVEKILLFGSYAYGKPMEGSDVDYLVIMDHDKASNRKQMLEIMKTYLRFLFQWTLSYEPPRT